MSNRKNSIWTKPDFLSLARLVNALVLGIQGRKYMRIRRYLFRRWVKKVTRRKKRTAREKINCASARMVGAD